MDGVYMIPSSVHEFLLLVMDKEYVNCGYVKQMIKEAKQSLLRRLWIVKKMYYSEQIVLDSDDMKEVTFSTI
jgi:uncharacterized protein YunC (DUF1805 family)